MTTLNQRIARNVKAARTAADLTQQELATAANVAVVTVARLEQGRTRHPRGQEFDRIAAALGHTADDLYGIPDRTPELAASSAVDEAAGIVDFRTQLADVYGPENVDFIDAVARAIKAFPPKEAGFVRIFLLGGLRALHNPRENRRDGGSPVAGLTHAG
jgi:transcriptional regulator with XRE-family HTH domain